MGQGSRGGNSGLSSSGVRQRRDKEETGQRVVINNRNSNSNSAQGGKGGKGRRGFGGHNFPNGFPNLGLPHFGGNSGSGSGNKGTQKKGKTTPPPPATKQNKLKKITRIKPVRVKLTKQRTNKTPN